MRRHFKRLLKSILCTGLILSLGGCWNSRELDTLAIVRGIGIDTSAKDPGQVQLTAQLVKPADMGTSKNGASKGSDETAFWNAESTGDTVFSAIREVTSKSSRKLFFPHNEIIIFGRDAAESGIQKYLDFFERDPETRGKVILAVAEKKASDILDVKSELEKIPADNISDLIDEYANVTSQIQSVKLTDFIDCFMSPSAAIVTPLLEVTQEGDEKTVVVTGTAVFKSDKMVGTLDRTEGRGLMWVLGKVKSGIITVKDAEGNLVSTEIIRSKTKMTPVLENGKPLIKIEINEEGNIGEEDGTENLSELPQVAELESKIAEEIGREVAAALKKAKALHADIFCFGRAIYRRYPGEWKKMEDNWDEQFQALDVELHVNANLRLMGKSGKPLVPGQE